MGHLPSLITSIIIISVQVITVCMYYILYWGLEIHTWRGGFHHKCVVSTSFLIKEETRHAAFSRPCVCVFTIPYVKICNTLCNIPI